MAIRIQCSGCGKAYSLQDAMAGRRVKCPACGATIDVPAAGLPGDIPDVEPLAAAGPGANAALHVKLIGIFDIIAGALNAAWAGLMVVEVLAVAFGAFESDPDFPAPVAVILFLGMFVLSAAAAVFLIVTGVRMLKRRPGSRKLALVAAIVCCASAWGCCIWPLTLAAGIYSLVALNKDSVKAALGG